MLVVLWDLNRDAVTSVGLDDGVIVRSADDSKVMTGDLSNDGTISVYDADTGAISRTS